jgi:hypothetical protein
MRTIVCQVGGLCQAGESFRRKMELMSIAETPRTTQTPTEDPQYPAAVERVTAAVRHLQEKGIIDGQGRRIRQDLPPDMQEDADRDFGG